MTQPIQQTPVAITTPFTPFKTVSQNNVVVVGVASTVIAATRTGRARRLTLKNTSPGAVFLGIGATALATMCPLAQNETITLDTNLAVNGIVATGTSNVAVLDLTTT